MAPIGCPAKLLPCHSFGQQLVAGRGLTVSSRLVKAFNNPSNCMRYWLSLLWLLTAGIIRAQQLPPGAQQVLDSVMRAYKVPALAAAIVEPTGIGFVYGGVRRIGQPEVIQPTDFLHLGSETQFSAAGSGGGTCGPAAAPTTGNWRVPASAPPGRNQRWNTQ